MEVFCLSCKYKEKYDSLSANKRQEFFDLLHITQDITEQQIIDF